MLSRRYRKLPIHPCSLSHMGMHTPPLSPSPTSGPSFTTDEPTQTHYYHRESIVYISLLVLYILLALTNGILHYSLIEE